MRPARPQDRVKQRLHSTVSLQCLGGIHFNALVAVDQSVAPENSDVMNISVPVQQEVLSLRDKGITTVECNCCAPSSHPRVAVSIGSLEFCAIVDSGSEISLIRKSIVGLCKQESDLLIKQNEVVQIEGFTGVSRLTEGTVRLILELGDTVETRAHNFAVVPDEIIPNCCLLGMDFILRNNLSIDCAAGLCLLNGNVNAAVELLPCVQEAEVLVTVVSADSSAGEHPECSAEETITNLLDVESAKNVQATNPYLLELLELIKAGIGKEEWPDHVKQYRSAGNKLCVRDGILVFIDGPLQAIVVSLDLLVDMAIAAHFRMMHIGRDKLVHLIRRHVWHPKLYSVC